ncbi:MAG: TMEM165/GDT1 family protein [Sphaerochaetaceae bacterium]|nr:TMEM165/GDT1 family protein [Sphaerochaetaceae bacterium]
MLFFEIFLAVFIAEMGDKTQLMLVALTNKYKIRDIVIGTFFAILVLNLIAVLAGSLVGEMIPTYLIKLIASIAFLYFAVASLKNDDEEEEHKNSNISFAPLAVFSTFFIAEIGDKTQLTAITFGANEGLDGALFVFLGASLGLFAADIIGLMVGYLMKSRLPEGFLKILSFIIFTIFGFINLPIALGMMFDNDNSRIIPIMVIVFIQFVVISYHQFFLSRKKKNEQNA